MSRTSSDTAAGTGTAAESQADQAQIFFIIRDWQPGQVVHVAFLTIEQAQDLPNVPADALQIAVAPAGGL